MIDGDACVSTTAQDLHALLDPLKAAGCERIFHDTLSGRTKERLQLKRLLKTAALRDAVIIPAIDRLNRDIADLLTIARDMKAAGVGWRSMVEPMIDPTSEFSGIGLALAAQLEQKRICERTAIGHAAAKAAGKRLSRASKMNPRYQLRKAIQRREAGNERLPPSGAATMPARPRFRSLNLRRGYNGVGSYHCDFARANFRRTGTKMD